FGIDLPPVLSASGLMLLFAVILYCGTRFADYLNRIFMIGLAGCFIALLATLSPNVKLTLLRPASYQGLWVTLPVIVTTFGYQIVIPSVRRYLDDNIKQLVKVIIVGSTIPLLTYIAWELLILGVIPYRGTHGLKVILATGQPAIGLTQSLQGLLQAQWIGSVAKFLSFFVIATSFIGVSLSLFDFLCDGFRIERNHVNKLLITAVTFIPPIFFTLLYPTAFMAALGYAGILVAVLLIIIPIAMVISGRYYRHEPPTYRTPGGIISITTLLLFAIAVIIIELFLS
ncbi:MAG: hypothetical protein KDH94_06730, partial [Coxiellaceae bacterium]|nr:hypothetical protein [Coxiellaceae bacterium]